MFKFSGAKMKANKWPEQDWNLVRLAVINRDRSNIAWEYVFEVDSSFASHSVNRNGTNRNVNLKTRLPPFESVPLLENTCGFEPIKTARGIESIEE